MKTKLRSATAPSAPANRATESWCSIGLTLVTLALFWQVHSFEFVNFDDHEYVTENPHVLSGLSAESFAWALTTFDFAFWHPLTWWSLELDATLFGVQAGGYHVTNLVLHVANTLLLFWSLRAMTGAVARSACVATLFAIHPLHVESVVWISERKDVLSTLFWMLTLWAYCRYAAQPSWGRYSMVVVPFALGLAAKSMLVTLPCLLLLLDFWPLRRWPDFQAAALPRLVREKVPLLVLSAAFCVVSVVAQSERGAIATIDQLPLVDRFTNAVVSYVAYLVKAVWPVQLGVFYPLKQHALAEALAAATLLVAASVWVWHRRRTQPYLTVGWFWYLGTLVPVIGLVQVGEHGMADRFTYVPLIGIFLAAVWWAADLAEARIRSRPLLATLATLVFTGFGLCTWVQVGYWRDSLTLWQHTVKVAGANHVSCSCLGIALRQRGRSKEALPWLEKAAKFATEDQSTLAGTFVNLGALQLETGDGRAALKSFQRAVEILENLVRDNPQLVEYLGLMANCHERVGGLQTDARDRDAALASHRRALAIREQLAGDHPTVTEYQVEVAGTCYNLGNVEIELGDAREGLAWQEQAAEALEGVLAREPGHARANRCLGNTYWGRARALERLNRHAQASSDWERASDLADGPLRLFLRMKLVEALARAGNHARASSEARALAMVPDLPADVAYGLGCALSRAAAAAADQPELSEHYSAEAIDFLQRARQAGFFADAAHVARLRESADVDSLRERDDFRKLCEELESP